MTAHDFAPARTPVSSTGFGPALSRTLVYSAGKVRMVTRALINRAGARRLNEFSDRELDDIGLTREDLGHAFSKPLTVDPTIEFARRARENRRKLDRGAY
ncbi:MAG: DUF1127 domain-containing protein [Hoeflea sp.]|uniref:DUF1127 domain-containing protein n=1 Tax=Hoeflea sp. TaxID=1940281 RepID=UPI0032EF2372